MIKYGDVIEQMHILQLLWNNQDLITTVILIVISIGLLIP